MHSTVRLAQSLSGFTAEELEGLMRVRGARADTPHLTDLALQLLKTDNITRTLRTLTRTEIVALAQMSDIHLPEAGRAPVDDAPGDAHARLRLLALTADGGPLPEIRDSLAALLEASDGIPPMPDGPDVQRSPGSDWAQRAFLETQQAVLVLRYAREMPLKLTRAGTVAKVSEKLLAEEVRARPDTLPLIIAGLQAIGALSAHGGYLHATPLGESWSLLPHPERWVAFCAGVLAGMPQELAAATRMSASDLRYAEHHALPALYPLADDATVERVRAFVALAEHLSITADGVLSPPAKALHDRAPNAVEVAANLATQAFPTTVAGVYLQPDLSVIAPGPIDPSIGLRLLELADLTAPGLATSFVLSERSLSRALDRGWDAAEIRSFLMTASLTPIPQPLEYLLHDLSQRHGTIVVAPLNTPDGATLVRPRDARIARELQADSRLNLLSLTPAPDEAHAFITRLSVEHVISLLADARYPATRDLHLAPASRHAPDTDRDDLDAIIARITERLDPTDTALNEAAERLSTPDPEHGGLNVVPMLELAAGAGQHLLITVTDGKTEHLLELLPLSVAKGRLRALDPRAQLERTLSIRAITSVEPVHN